MRVGWWEVFHDADLNRLEPQVAQANQSLKAAEGNFRAARAAVATSRSQLAPTLDVGASTGTVRESTNQPYFNQTTANNAQGSLSLPFDLNY